MLVLLKDPSERIFCEKEKDEYLPLRKSLKVNYKYRVINDMVYSLRNSIIFEDIRSCFNQANRKKTKSTKKSYFGDDSYSTR
jgi:hypothetical protein